MKEPSFRPDGFTGKLKPPAIPLASGAGYHSDDIAVDKFAAAMKEKLKVAREQKGRSGWETCTPEYLANLMYGHLHKGDMRDVANFAMMIWHVGNGAAFQVPIVDQSEIGRLKAENAKLQQALSRAGKAIAPFADAVFNDNGDMSVNLTLPDANKFIAAYFAERAIRAALEPGRG